MRVVIWTIVAYGFFFMNLVVHEFGHGIAMYRRGIIIKRAGVGVPIKGLTLTVQSKRLGIPLTFSPLLLGAFVEPRADQQAKIEALPKRQQAWIYGAGIVTNIMAAGVTILIGCLGITIGGYGSMHTLRLAAVTTAAMLVVAAVRQWFCLIAVPSLGLAMMGLFVWSIFNQASASKAGIGVSGPIGVVAAAQSHNVLDALTFGISIALGLGLINMLPLLPLDGGRVASILVPQKLRKGFSAISGMAFIVFIVYVFAGDISRLIH